MKARNLATVLSLLSAVSFSSPSLAGPNDFFGSSIGGSPDLTQGSSAAAGGNSGFAFAGGAPGGSQTPAVGQSIQSSPMSASSGSAPAPSGPPAGDYTVDEKRVQHKYKDNVKRAERLVARGQEMMRSHDDKIAKKGKVLKEIGEKAVADLKAANPFPEIAAKTAPKTN